MTLKQTKKAVVLAGASLCVLTPTATAADINIRSELYVTPVAPCGATTVPSGSSCPALSTDIELMRDDYKVAFQAYASTKLQGGQQSAHPRSIEFDLNNDGVFEDPGSTISQRSCFPNLGWFLYGCGDSGEIGDTGHSTTAVTPKISEPQREVRIRVTAIDGTSSVKSMVGPMPFRRGLVKWSDPSAKVRTFVWGKSAGDGSVVAIKSEVPGDSARYPESFLAAGVLRAGVKLAANDVWVESDDPGFKRRVAFVSWPNLVSASGAKPQFAHRDDVVMGICQVDGVATKVDVEFVQLNGTVERRTVDLAGKGNGAIVGRGPANNSFQPPAGWCDNVKDLTGGGSTTTSPTPTPVAVTAKVSASSRTAQSKFSIKTTGIKDGSTLRLLWSRTGAKQFVKRSKVTSNRAVGVAPKVAGNYRLVVKSGSKTLLSKKFVVRAS